jgi:hypothetical protein
LPELRNEVRKKIKEKKSELAVLGTPVANDKASQGWLLLHLLNKFSDQFKEAIDGVSNDVNINELYVNFP